MSLLRKNQMHHYQKSNVEHLMEHKFAGLFLDMGLGKTVISLTVLDKLMFEELEIKRALVVGPKRVIENVWIEEAKTWEHLKHLKLSRVIGNEKQRQAALKETADIYLISRDNIAWLCGLYGGSVLPFDMLVIDESSSFKNQKAIRFKALRGVQPSFKRIVILTGTPAPNGMLDLWAQLYLLDRGARLGKFIGKYRDEYFKPNKRNGEIVYSYKLKDGAESQIHQKIGDICISMQKEDYLDLPARISNYINIKLPEPIQKLYDKFEEEQVLALVTADQNENQISAVNAAALSNKLLQFAGGAVYYYEDDLVQAERFVHEVHDLKIEETLNLIEDANGQPILIFWNYQHERDRLLKALKTYKPVQLKTANHINDWNSGKIQILMMHPASGGHGLNLQKGGHIILWFSPTWSLELYQQANARLDRQGQKYPVIVHHLIAINTIDVDVHKAITEKNKTQDNLLKAIKAIIKKHKK